MRILTVRQPWAWAIIHGGKNVENRPRNIAGGYRGPVAIHAGLSVDMDAMTTPNIVGAVALKRLFKGAGHPATFKESPKGAIIGVVDMVDAHESGDCYTASIERAAHLHRSDRDAFDRLPITNSAGGLIGRASLCSSWAQSDAHHLVLANPRPLAEPIPCTGALGLRRLDGDMITRINEGLS